MRLTESDIKRIIKKILKESDVNVSGIVHRHIDTFVNETVDKFLEVMDEISKELSEHGVYTSSHFAEVEMHFEKEMVNLSEEVIHKIHEDEQIQKSIESGSSGNLHASGH